MKKTLIIITSILFLSAYPHQITDFQKAKLAFGNRDYIKAIELFEKVINSTLTAENVKFESALYIAECYIAETDINNARNYILKALNYNDKDFPDDRIFSRELIENFIDQSQLSKLEKAKTAIENGDARSGREILLSVFIDLPGKNFHKEIYSLLRDYFSIILDPPVPPRPVRHVFPEFPKSEKQAGNFGKIALLLTINNYGEVISTEVIQNTTGSKVIEDSSCQAAIKSEFLPGRDADGRNITSMYIQKYSFGSSDRK